MAFAEENSGQTEESSWWDYANCLGVDPDLFFPERGRVPKKLKKCVEVASFAKTVSNMR